MDIVIIFIVTSCTCNSETAQRCTWESTNDNSIWETVLRSAKRAPANVRQLNNRKWRQSYCLVGERSRALALLNAAQGVSHNAPPVGWFKRLFGLPWCSCMYVGFAFIYIYIKLLYLSLKKINFQNCEKDGWICILQFILILQTYRCP